MNKQRSATAPRVMIVLLGTLLLSACASTTRPPVLRTGPPLSEAEVAELAALLRVEDQRSYEPALLESSARSAAPVVRRYAALAIGRLQDARGVPLLLQLLSDPDTAVAAIAAFALGQVGDTTAVPHLVPLLGSQAAARNPTVAAEAAAALGKLRTGDAASALNGFLLTAPVGHGGTAVAEQALLAIWRFPRSADLAPVLRWTDAPDPEIRWRAAYALVRRPDPAATPRLLRLAADPDPLVRALAVRGLTGPLADSAGLAPAAVLPVVLSLSADADPRTAVSAIRSLGTFRAPEAVTRLVSLVGGSAVHAIPAAESLGRLGSYASASAPALREAALNRSNAIGLRSAALLALVQVAPATAPAVAASLAAEGSWRARAEAGRAFSALAPRPRAELAALFRDPDPRVAALSLSATVEAAGDSVAPLRVYLLEMLGSRDVRVRTAALAGISRLRDPATLPLILDAYQLALQDTLNDAALEAISAVAALQARGTPAARALFRRFPSPGDPLLRRRAVTLFGDTARTAWGEPLPIETGLSTAEYEARVRRWIAPAYAGGAPPRARIVTESGSIDLELFAADAPLTVHSFVYLTEDGYFDGQEWPRVVPNFVIQGGDPRGDQSGGPGYAIRDEINRHRYERGTLGMALSGPDTGGSQFFITHSPQPHLDGGYTVFGRVIAGMEVVDRVMVGERIQSIRLLP